MEELQVPQASWGAELKGYENAKRRFVDEGLLRSPQIRVSSGAMKRAERCFDPLLQRYRDGGTELQQRTLEERERVNHLNRAQDIQILRGQPFDIIRHESKLEAIAPGVDPARLGHNPRRSQGKTGPPDTAVDYNLISNQGFDKHHWAKPGRRPRCVERPPPRQRSVPGFEVKDFNIVTNRYKDQHEARSKNDRHLAIVEAAQKDMVHNAYNPVTQQFTDPRNEECARTCDDARGVELNMRANAQLPPSFKGRESSFYNVVSHQKHDDGMLRMYDEAEAGRKDRYNNRYITEHNWHAQDIKGDHITNVRMMNRTAPERFDEEHGRGYDIVSNKMYGHGPKNQTLYAPFAQSRQSPWQQATSGSKSAHHGMSSTMSLPGRFGDSHGNRSEAGRSRRSVSSHGSARPSAYAGRAG